MKNSNDDILTQAQLYDKNICQLVLDEQEIIQKTFENCQFNECSFKEAKFIECKFVDCDFKLCNLSSAEIDNSYFSSTNFYECKIIGVNWAKARWPYIQLASPIKFYQSNISYCSFYELKLSEIVIEECKAHSVDFREGNFSNGNFTLTDLESSLFVNTTLTAADFTGAFNYSINPFENKIKKAKFSMPDAINLLLMMGIELKEE